MKVKESNSCNSWEQWAPSGDWPVVDLCCQVVQDMRCALDYEWEDVGRDSQVGAPCGKRCVMYANFVCGKLFTCSFALIAGRLGWRMRVMGHTRRWVKCVSVSIFMCKGGKARWGLTNEQLTCSDLLSCTTAVDWNRIQLNLNFGWLPSSGLSLISAIWGGDN